jgi:F-type H+-transporting ATPase subunit delta
MHGRVQGYTDAVLETAGLDFGAVAGELEAFMALLATSGDLRVALENPTTPVPVRRSIVRELLAKRVSAPTLQLLSFAVQGGTAGDYEQEVAGVAAAVAAKRDGMVLLDEGPLGRTAATERLEGYAAAVLGPVSKRRLGAIEDALFRFMRTVDASSELRAAMTTAELPVKVRKRIVHDLLGRRGNAEPERLASYAVGAGRPRDYVLLLERLVQRVATEANCRVADVRSAAEMTEPQRLSLAAVLTRLTGSELSVRVGVEPDLLGGFVASIGDIVIDASLRHRLEQARGLLFSPPPLSPPAS